MSQQRHRGLSPFLQFRFLCFITHSQPWRKNIEFPQPSISSAPDIQQSTLSGLNDLGSLKAHDLPSVLSLEGNPTPHHSAYIIHFISSRHIGVLSAHIITRVNTIYF